MADAASVLEEALRLSAEDRARVARELIHSLETEEADAPLAWRDEIRDRIDQIEAGTAKLEDWESVRARLKNAART